MPPGGGWVGEKDLVIWEVVWEGRGLCLGWVDGFAPALWGGGRIMREDHKKKTPWDWEGPGTVGF